LVNNCGFGFLLDVFGYVMCRLGSIVEGVSGCNFGMNFRCDIMANCVCVVMLGVSTAGMLAVIEVFP
jgi:hypothetical protein